MKLLRKVGATSEIWQVFVADSSSTTGAGLTGLTNASSGLTAYYHRDTDTTATAISLVTMTVGTFTSSGFKEVDSTNMPGVYQFCPPNAALAAGAKSCIFVLKGATNMAPLPIEVQLTSLDPDTAALTAAAIATGVWQDTTSGDFTVASSIGKSLYTSGAVPGAASGLLIAGSNAATTFSGLTTGALSCTTLTASGAVALQSTLTVTGAVLFSSTFATTGTTTFNAFTVTNAFTVSGATTLTGAVTATNASNSIKGIAVTATGLDLVAASSTFSQALTDAVLDELLSGHTVSGSAGAVLSGIATTLGTPADLGTGATVAHNLSDVYSEANSASNNAADALAAANSLITTVGVAGAGLTALAPASTALSNVTWTNAKAAFLDGSVLSRQATFTVATGVTFPTNFGSLSIDANGRAKIQSGVPKNTALSGFGFVMVDSSDHVTGKTGLTVTATRSIDGAAFAACTNSPAEVSGGEYKIDLSAADLNGNTVVLKFAATGADTRFIEILPTP